MARKVVISDDYYNNNSVVDTGYSNNINNTKTGILPVVHANKVAIGFIKDINEALKFNENPREFSDKLESFVIDFINQPRHVGSPESFHNFAVRLAEANFQDFACDILECGLKQYPSNSTLLADVLIYSIDCGRSDLSAAAHEKLNNIPKEDWTWRCFSFELAYIRHLMNNIARSKEEKLYYKEQLNEMAKEYREYLPYDEGGYRELSRIQKNNPVAKLEILDTALENEFLGACASCAFEKAELLFQHKKYDDALNAIQRALEDSVQRKNVNIDEYYLRFLRALCNIVILNRNPELKTAEFIYKIYSDMEFALLGIDDRMQARLKTQAQALENDTRIKVPARYENLYTLISY